MKIELIKKQDLTGEVYYYTSVDGNLVPNSLSFDLQRAEDTYEKIVNSRGVKSEVIKSVTLNK